MNDPIALLSRLSSGMDWDSIFWLLTSLIQFMVVAWGRPSPHVPYAIPTLFTFVSTCLTIAPSLLMNCPNKFEAATNRMWRRPINREEFAVKDSLLETYAPWQGLAMSRVVIPFLFRSMAAMMEQLPTSATTFEKGSEISLWHAYGFVTTVMLGFLFWGYKPSRYVMVFLAVILMPQPFVLSDFRFLPWIKKKYWVQIVLFLGTWTFMFDAAYSVPPLHLVFTKGELTVVACGIAVAVSATVVEIMDPSLLTYQSVALVGCVGCGFAIGLLYCVTNLVANRRSNNIHLIFELAFLASVPLLLVEFTLRKSKQGDTTYWYMFPRCLDWLWRFLTETEANPGSPWQLIVSFPRYVWLLYWVVNLVLATILLPYLQNDARTEAPASTTLIAKVRRNYSTVVVRKFFHGLAVILFAPVAIAAPELLSLSYAIATALLMIMEYVRKDLPIVQAFYNEYLDPSKDDSAKVIVSHTALILGCAIPHWIADCCFHGRTMETEKIQLALVLLLRLWGVISLGIGDALGAIVGTWYGRTIWGGPTRRTVEGSTAMFLGMVLSCYCLVGKAFIEIWMPVAILTTILEVVTLQIDNMVLPLAGSAWILFLASFRNVL